MAMKVEPVAVVMVGAEVRVVVAPLVGAMGWKVVLRDLATSEWLKRTRHMAATLASQRGTALYQYPRGRHTSRSHLQACTPSGRICSSTMGSIDQR